VVRLRQGNGDVMHAGPEVSVASTKACTSTAVAFALLTPHLGRVRDLSRQPENNGLEKDVKG
jgi:glucosamine 6-phosphate synthetase-like amidotransferase/phosphosugar isomerase protein